MLSAQSFSSPQAGQCTAQIREVANVPKSDDEASNGKDFEEIQAAVSMIREAIAVCDLTRNDLCRPLLDPWRKPTLRRGERQLGRPQNMSRAMK